MRRDLEIGCASSSSRSRRSRRPAPSIWRRRSTNHAMRQRARLSGWSVSGSKPQTCSSKRCSPARSGTVESSARYAGLTGSPDESGQRRRERGLAKAGNARVRRGMIELAWGHLVHQKGSPLSAWYRMRTADARGGTRKTMIVALGASSPSVLWWLATTGEAPEGLQLRPAA